MVSGCRVGRRALLHGLGAAGGALALARPGFAQMGVAARSMARQWSEYVAASRYDRLDAATIEAVKGHFIDAVGCAMAAQEQEPIRNVRRAAVAEGGAKATILGTADKASTEWATFVNGSAIRHFDLNDVYAGRETGHPSDNMAACLAVAEAEGHSGQDLILAIVLAYEVDCRLLDAAAISPKGWDHPSYSLAAAGLGAGKLMNLSTEELEQTVNLAVNSHIALNQTRVQAMSNWKGMADADAARNAVFAAQLARAHVSGPAPIFEGTFGFMKMVSGPFEIDFADLGGRGGHYKVNDCAIKFYPAQAQTQTAIPAAAALAAKIGDLDRIARIEVSTTRPGFVSTASEPAKWRPRTSETADHSLPYIVARALLDREITIVSYRPDALSDPRALALMDKLVVHEDAALTAMMPRYSPNRIVVTLTDGQVLTSQVNDLPGFATRPMTRDDFGRKFRGNAKAVMHDEAIDRFLSIAWTLDQRKDFGALFGSLVVDGG